MQEKQITNLLNAPRCNATSKRTGQPCRAPAMKNGKCYYHGGASTGPRTPEGKKRSSRNAVKHGFYTRGAIAERKFVRSILNGKYDYLFDQVHS